MKKILFIPILLILALGFIACSDDEKDMRIELASPLDVKVKTELATATFKWLPVDKTGAYAYALDDSENYTLLDASETEVTISGISKGMHTFKIYAVGVEGSSFDSAIRELEFEIDPSVAAPIVTYTIERVHETRGNVIITWKQVNGATGYAYKVKDETEWTNVGIDVLSLTLTDVAYEDKFSFTIKALGNPPTSEDSDEYTELINLETAVGMWIVFTKDVNPAKPVELIETGTGTGIFNATISCLAEDEFYVNIDNTKHGFMSYSGNGGVGTINSKLAAAPFYNNDRGDYYVRESIGLLDSKNPINNFYTNVDGARKVLVQIDTNGDNPSYYLQLVDEAPDASIVLAQYFDLMAYGGDWATYTKGTAYAGGANITAADTGLSAGISDKTNATAFGSTWVSTGFAPTFEKNKGMEGWSFEHIFEFAGYFRLSHSTKGQYGVLTTPKLGSASNLEVTFDGMLFAAFRDGGENGFIEVKVLNGGKISSASVVKDGEGSPITIQPADNSSFHIVKSYHTDYANADMKKWSNYTFTIEGATADTQIMWNTKTDSKIDAKHYRYCIDNIIVKKK